MFQDGIQGLREGALGDLGKPLDLDKLPGLIKQKTLPFLI